MTFSIIQKSQLEGANRIDAEYFMSEYLELEKKLLKTNSCKKWGEIDGKFITGPFGSEFNVENYSDNGVHRYIRGKDVKEFFLLENDNVYIPEKDFERLTKYKLQEGDILISVVGTLGNTAIVAKKNLPAIFSCKSTVFRSESIDNFYFIAYLNSKFGHDLLLRNARGQVQTGLNIEDLKGLNIFFPNDTKQVEISNLIRRSIKLTTDSTTYYTEAENLLLEELGLKDFKIPEDLSYIVNYSDTEKVNRVDADYFQPKYQIILDKIKNNNAKSLGELVTLKKGLEPGGEAYQEDGKPFIRVSSLSKFGIETKDQKCLSNELYQKLKPDYEPRVGEILLTKDATPGISYVVKEQIEGIISGGILRLKLKSYIEPEYLSLCISSLIGQMQAERDAGGSVIVHWKPEQIKNILIPVLPTETQQKIADLVIKSHEARKKSKEFLEEAKRKVEEMVEKAD